MSRKNLPEMFELSANVLDNPAVSEIAATAKVGMTQAQINAMVLRICAEVVKSQKKDADELVSMYLDKPLEEVEKLSNKEYGRALRNTITVDVLGFFG